LRLVRGETTISEAADQVGVDRWTIMRLRQVAKDGAIAALAESRPGVQQAKRDLELEAARSRAAGCRVELRANARISRRRGWQAGRVDAEPRPPRPCAVRERPAWRAGRRERVGVVPTEAA